MIIVNFSEIAPVPPQNFRKDVLANIYKNCNQLIEQIPYDDMTMSLIDWETDLFMLADNRRVDDDWYTRALICICIRGLRGDSRPNILNFPE